MADLAHQARRRRGPLVDRARAELAAGRPWMARAQLNSLLQRDPDHAEGRALLVATLREMGDEAGADAVEKHWMHGSTPRPGDGVGEDQLTGLARVWERIKNAVATALAAILILLVVVIVAAPFALFGIGLYQVGAWIGLW